MLEKLSNIELLKINEALINRCNENNIVINDIIDNLSSNNLSFENLNNSYFNTHIFGKIFDHSPIGIFIFDNEANFLDCNNSFCELIGSSKDKLINMNILQTINNKEVKNAISNCLQNINSSYSGEYIPAIGERKSYIRINFSTLTDNENNITGGIGIAEDITFLKKHELELNTTKAQKIALINNIPAIAWFKDYNGNYLSVNQYFCNLCNKDYNDIIGKNDYDIWYKELADKIVQEDLKVIAQKTKLNRDVEFINNEGIKFYLEIHKTPVFDDNNIIIGTSGFANDISIKKKNEQDLKTEKLYFESLFNNSPEAIVIADVNSKVLRINKQFTKMFQYTENEIVGENIDELISDEKEQEFAKTVTQQIQSGKNPIIETTRLRKDRTTVDVVILGVPITLSNNNTVIYGIYQDISRQKAEQKELLYAKEKAIESDKLKTNFLANMSHELRTPLNGILGFSELLLSEDINDDILEMVQSIHQSGNRLLQTINSILDISIIEANKLNIEIKEEDLKEIISNLVKKHSSKAAEKDLEIYFNFKGIALIHTDKKIFENIINNLLDNAIKYTNKGSINITISKENTNNQPNFSITIKDTGIGIEKENFEKIFYYFSQVSEGYTRSYEGTGLGLSITKHYVEILNGKISIESIVKEGSSFTVSFPLNENDKLAFESEKKFSLPLKPLLLLVEDEKTNAEYVMLSIRKEYEVELATTGIDAINMANEKQYNLILMDINLGKDINGIVATIEIRKNYNYKDIPIIAVTANAMHGQKEMLLSNGLSDYISKPFRKEMLLNIIKTNLEKYESEFIKQSLPNES